MAKAKTIARELKELRERAGRSMAYMATVIGKAGASSYQHYENPERFGKSYLPFEIVAKILPALVGRGQPPVTEEEVLELAGPRPTPPPVMVKVPLLTWVSAGAFDRDDWQQVAKGQIEWANLPKGDWVAFKVEGDSMDRVSPPESIILVDLRDKNLVPNGCYIIADDDNRLTYKRFRPNPPRFEPVSTNPAHEPIFVDRDITVIGRVRKTVLEL